MYHVSRFLYSHLSFSESCIPDRLRIQKHLRLYVWWKREGQRRRRWGKLRQSNPAAARLDTDDGEDRGVQAMQAHRDYMKQQVSSAPSNQPQNQKTLINQNIPGGKRKEQGSASGKETASEDDDDSAADIEGDGGQDIPLPASGAQAESLLVTSRWSLIATLTKSSREGKLLEKLLKQLSSNR